MAFRNPLQQLPGTTVPASGIIGQIQGSQLQAGTVTANEIAANAITAGAIAAGAIDGKTITGATIRTAGAGLRWEMDSWGADALRGYTGDPNELSPGLISIGAQQFNSGFSIAGLFSYLVSPQGTGGARASIMLSADRTGTRTSAVVDADDLHARQISCDRFNGPAPVLGAGIPYATASGSWACPQVAPGAQWTQTPNFPAGRFTVAPNVTVMSGSSRLTDAAFNVSTGGFYHQVQNWTTSGAAAANECYWTATQMTSYSADG